MTTVANAALGKGKIIGIDKAGVCVRLQQIAMVDGKAVRDSTDARNTRTGLRAAATLARTSSDSTVLRAMHPVGKFRAGCSPALHQFPKFSVAAAIPGGQANRAAQACAPGTTNAVLRAMRTAGHNSFPSDR